MLIMCAVPSIRRSAQIRSWPLEACRYRCWKVRPRGGLSTSSNNSCGRHSAYEPSHRTTRTTVRTMSAIAGSVTVRITREPCGPGSPVRLSKRGSAFMAQRRKQNARRGNDFSHPFLLISIRRVLATFQRSPTAKHPILPAAVRFRQAVWERCCVCTTGCLLNRARERGGWRNTMSGRSPVRVFDDCNPEPEDKRSPACSSCGVCKS